MARKKKRGKKKIKIPQKKIMWYMILAVLLGLSFLFDNKVAEFFKGVQCPYMDAIFGFITSMKLVFFVLIIISTVFLFEERKSRWIGVLWFSFAVAFTLSILLKHQFLRLRPSGIVEKLAFGKTDPFSFPSTHASSSFATLPVLDMEFRKIKWFYIVFVALVAISRLYLGLHYPSDVIGGLFLGLLIGDIFVFIERRYGPFDRLLKFFLSKKGIRSRIGRKR